MWSCRFDASKAAACLAAYRAAPPCRTTWLAPPDDPRAAACHGVFTGVGPIGGACVHEADCAQDGGAVVCAGRSPPATPAGRCAAVREVGVGAPCSLGDRCASGLDCAGASAPVCVAPVAIGQACAPDGERCVAGG